MRGYGYTRKHVNGQAGATCIGWLCVIGLLVFFYLNWCDHCGGASDPLSSSGCQYSAYVDCN